MDSEILEKIGLNQSEARIYLALLKTGSCKAGRLAKETNYNRTTVYKALESLIQRGLAGYVVKENRKYFEPADPKNIMRGIEKEERVLQEKKKEVAHAIPQLSRLFEENKEELEATIFKGIKGMKTVFDDIQKTLKKGDEYLAFGVPEYAQQFWGYFEEFNKALQKNKVHRRIIFDQRASKNIASCKKYGYQVKTLSKEFMSPAEINVYENNVAIVLWNKTPLVIFVRGKDIAQSFRQYFNLLWRLAK